MSSSKTTQPMTRQLKREGILHVSPSSLPCWREVMQPHPDVAQGRYHTAEFAADLAQVAHGEGAQEYLDPVEFFARTYVTEGMTGLLVQALKRVSGKDGEPVIQLKTAFGGGKTHTMLALYHLLRGTVSMDRIPAVAPVLEAAGLDSLPRAHVAVLVGTAPDLSSSSPTQLPGVAVNTLWGELAAQLALSSGNTEAYNLVREADEKGVSPGSKALKQLFDACGPCLVLIDELVAYARRLYGVQGLPAGSFDNFISFIQELTEAARASRNSLVVASIPESDTEIGGEAGRKALETIEHTFGRMEAVWKPVASGEGFEVVRRRLFLDCANPAAREEVCTRFSKMYLDNPTDFPPETREVEYRNRLLSCYPIHPEVFDRLYDDWATLERFQRTRGVLRLMAAVIHELWMGNDAGLLIMPGSLPLDTRNVRDELTNYLTDGWNAIVDGEVDGKSSLPFRQDKEVLRYGQALASRRVARAIMLGSAPTSRAQNVRGVEASRIRLGVVQPGEQIALFNDALNGLQNRLAYLYSNGSGDRFWYDTRPTLRKTVADRATQIPASDVEAELERRLKNWKREGSLAGLHVCPGSSLDVPDEPAVRLVVLRPSQGFDPGQQESPALKAARDIREHRGTGPRNSRNMLIFLAPDQAAMAALKEEARHYLAWTSVQKDSQVLNLDAAQNRETENSRKRSDETLNIRLNEAWCWLLVPTMKREKKPENMVLTWETALLGGGSEPVVTRAVRKLRQNEMIIDKWAPFLLLMELDELLWQDADRIQIKKLWEYLCTHCYLPRLSSYSVLEEAIRSGVASPQGEYFGYAAGVSGGRFVDLKYAEPAEIDPSGWLVRREAARKQKEAEKRPEPVGTGGSAGTDGKPAGTGGESSPEGKGPGSAGTDGGTPPPPSDPTRKRFFLSTPLELMRINRQVGDIAGEILNHLAGEKDATLQVTLEVQVSSPQGFSPSTIRVVEENCRTLKVSTFGFAED